MRLLVPGGAALLLAASLAVPAHAAVKVDGNRFTKAGLTKLNQGCVDSHAPVSDSPKLLIARGPAKPPLGNYSEGWRPVPGGYGAGWVAHVDHPTTLATVKAQIYAPSRTAHGRAVAFVHPAGDSGYWFGSADLGNDTKKGWHGTGNAAGLTYSWLHYPDASSPYDASTIDQTIAAMAASEGGDGKGAEVGFVYGCDENSFFEDAFQVATRNEGKTFDFGAYRTRAKATFASSPDKDRIAITAGGHKVVDGSILLKSSGKTISGPVLFQTRPAGQKGSWKTFAKGKSTRKAPARTKVGPAHNTQYRVLYKGNQKHEPSRSAPLALYVRMTASASFAQSTVVRGHAFTVSGRVRPGQRSAVILQRYDHGGWKAIKKGHSTSSGAYRLSAVAAEAGQHYFRVMVRGGDRNLDGPSRHILLKVVNPSGGGGGSTPSDPPDTPPDQPPGPTG